MFRVYENRFADVKKSCQPLPFIWKKAVNYIETYIAEQRELFAAPYYYSDSTVIKM